MQRWRRGVFSHPRGGGRPKDLTNIRPLTVSFLAYSELFVFFFRRLIADLFFYFFQNRVPINSQRQYEAFSSVFGIWTE